MSKKIDFNLDQFINRYIPSHTDHDDSVETINIIKNYLESFLRVWQLDKLNVYNFDDIIKRIFVMMDELKKYIDYLNGGICPIEKGLEEIEQLKTKMEKVKAKMERLS